MAKKKWKISLANIRGFIIIFGESQVRHKAEDYCNLFDSEMGKGRYKRWSSKHLRKWYIGWGRSNYLKRPNW